MDFELLKNAKESYERVTDTAKILEKNGWIDLHSDKLDMADVLELEMVRFIEYLIASDRTIDKHEVDVFRFITGYGGETIDSLKEDIENSTVMSYEFQSQPPLGLQLLVRGTNEYLLQNPEKESALGSILADYLFTYYIVGISTISADDTVTYNEKKDLKAYFATLMQYIKSQSYMAKNEAITEIKRDLIDASVI